MPRSVVSGSILDALIRKKIENVPHCGSVRALPVVRVTNGHGGVGGSNWEVPGWVGDQQAIETCRQHVGVYLAFLGAQFNLPNGTE